MSRLRFAILLLTAVVAVSVAVLYIAHTRNAPVRCEEMIDRQLFEFVGSEYERVALLVQRIRERYSLSSEEIEVVSDRGDDWMMWDSEQFGYVAYYHEPWVSSVWVGTQGFFPRHPTGFDVVECLGQPTHARAQLFIHPHNDRNLRYQLWYPDQGIMFQGRTSPATGAPLLVSNSDNFDNYVIFRPGSIQEAVGDVYNLTRRDQIAEIVQSIRPWRGSWSEIGVETP